MAILGKPYKIDVQFAGMCLLVTNSASAQVFLPNPTIVKASNHDPVLLIPDHKGLIGSPDASITLPGSSAEYGIWSLRQRSVRFHSAFLDTKFTIEMTDIPEGWEPEHPKVDEEWKSVRTLADVGEMGKTSQLKTALAPSVTGPVIPIHFGHVFALPPAEAKRRDVRLEFVIDPNEPPPTKARAMSDRISWRLPETRGNTTIELTGMNPTKITITEAIPTPIMISNVAAGACQSGNENHFDVYFELVRYHQRPRLRPAPGPTEDPPDFPEICRCAVVTIDKP